MINWKNPFIELPRKGDIVWILEKHPKGEPGQSCEISCGEVVEYINEENEIRLYVTNLDYTGHGGLDWEFPNVSEGFNFNNIYAWAPLNEINEPIFRETHE